MFTTTTHELRKRKKTISVQDTIDELCEFKRNQQVNNQIGDPRNNTATTLLYSHGSRKNLFCQYCKKKDHHISDCRKKKPQESQKRSCCNISHARINSWQGVLPQQHRVWRCWENGHLEKDYPLKKRTDEFKPTQNQKQFGKKGRAMVANGDNTKQSLVLRSDLD